MLISWWESNKGVYLTVNTMLTSFSLFAGTKNAELQGCTANSLEEEKRMKKLIDRKNIVLFALTGLAIGIVGCQNGPAQNNSAVDAKQVRGSIEDQRDFTLSIVASETANDNGDSEFQMCDKRSRECVNPFSLDGQPFRFTIHQIDNLPSNGRTGDEEALGRIITGAIMAGGATLLLGASVLIAPGSIVWTIPLNLSPIAHGVSKIARADDFGRAREALSQFTSSTATDSVLIPDVEMALIMLGREMGLSLAIPPQWRSFQETTRAVLPDFYSPKR